MAKFASIFVFVAFVALVNSTPVVRRDVSEILRHHSPNHGEGVLGNGIPGRDARITEEHSQKDTIGNYDFGYKQDDLQEHQQIGTVAIDPKTGNYTLDNVVGHYRYVRPDGLWQIVEYRADRNGFLPRIRTEKYVPGQFPQVNAIQKFALADDDDDYD